MITPDITYYFCCHKDIDLTYINKYVNNIDDNRINIICNEDNNIITKYNIIKEPYNDLQCFYGENSRMIYIYKLYKEGKIKLSDYISFNQYGLFFNFYMYDRMCGLLKYNDALVHGQYFDNIYNSYNSLHNGEDLLEIVNYICEKYNVNKYYKEYFLYDANYPGHYNIFILKKNIFIKYIEFIIDISDYYKRKHNINTQNDLRKYISNNANKYYNENKLNWYWGVDNQMRLFGFISERIFGLFLTINKINYSTFPYIDIQYLSKINRN